MRTPRVCGGAASRGPLRSDNPAPPTRRLRSDGSGSEETTAAQGGRISAEVLCCNTSPIWRPGRAPSCIASSPMRAPRRRCWPEAPTCWSTSAPVWRTRRSSSTRRRSRTSPALPGASAMGWSSAPARRSMRFSMTRRFAATIRCSSPARTISPRIRSAIAPPSSAMWSMRRPAPIWRRRCCACGRTR